LRETHTLINALFALFGQVMTLFVPKMFELTVPIYERSSQITREKLAVLQKPFPIASQNGIILNDTTGDVWDEFGKSCPPNVVGELVCKKPFPSVPLGIIGDASGAKFNSTYFEKWPGVWHHGDLASRTSEGGIIIHGRSDSTLNIGGVRIGTGEIYSALEKLEEVSDALAFSMPHDDDEQIVLLIIPRSTNFDKNKLTELIKKTVKTLCSPRHVPNQIYFVADLPRTFNGKLAEIAVTDLAHDRPIRNLSSLANPQALTEIAIMLGIKEQIN
jgi:acetoacetyl-CoA synthetase